jgi:hypothetical protein
MTQAHSPAAAPPPPAAPVAAPAGARRHEIGTRPRRRILRARTAEAARRTNRERAEAAGVGRERAEAAGAEARRARASEADCERAAEGRRTGRVPVLRAQVARQTGRAVLHGVRPNVLTSLFVTGFSLLDPCDLIGRTESPNTITNNQ